MSARKRINKNHPDYPVYIEKCKALFDRYDKLIDAEKARFPDWRGLDHPAMQEIRKLDRKRNAKLRKLQEEYAYLFTEDAMDG